MLPYTLAAFSELVGAQHYHFLNACIVLILASYIHIVISKHQKMGCIISFLTCTEKLQYEVSGVKTGFSVF